MPCKPGSFARQLEDCEGTRKIPQKTPVVELSPALTNVHCTENTLNKDSTNTLGNSIMAYSQLNFVFFLRTMQVLLKCHDHPSQFLVTFTWVCPVCSTLKTPFWKKGIKLCTRCFWTTSVSVSQFFTQLPSVVSATLSEHWFLELSSALGIWWRGKTLHTYFILLYLQHCDMSKLRPCFSVEGSTNAPSFHHLPWR